MINDLILERGMTIDDTLITVMALQFLKVFLTKTTKDFQTEIIKISLEDFQLKQFCIKASSKINLLVFVSWHFHLLDMK